MIFCCSLFSKGFKCVSNTYTSLEAIETMDRAYELFFKIVNIKRLRNFRWKRIKSKNDYVNISLMLENEWIEARNKKIRWPKTLMWNFFSLTRILSIRFQSMSCASFIYFSFYLHDQHLEKCTCIFCLKKNQPWSTS